jgi:hypothetical protein
VAGGVRLEMVGADIITRASRAGSQGPTGGNATGGKRKKDIFAVPSEQVATDTPPPKRPMHEEGHCITGPAGGGVYQLSAADCSIAAGSALEPAFASALDDEMQGHGLLAQADLFLQAEDIFEAKSGVGSSLGAIDQAASPDPNPSACCLLLAGGGIGVRW